MGGEISREGGDAWSKCVRVCVVFSVYEIDKGEEEEESPRGRIGNRMRARFLEMSCIRADLSVEPSLQTSHTHVFFLFLFFTIGIKAIKCTKYTRHACCLKADVANKRRNPFLIAAAFANVYNITPVCLESDPYGDWMQGFFFSFRHKNPWMLKFHTYNGIIFAYNQRTSSCIVQIILKRLDRCLKGNYYAKFLVMVRRSLWVSNECVCVQKNKKRGEKKGHSI